MKKVTNWFTAENPNSKDPAAAVRARPMTLGVSPGHQRHRGLAESHCRHTAHPPLSALDGRLRLLCSANFGGGEELAARLKDVAARAGVSVKTASNVVNNYPHIKPSTRARVQEAIHELRYRL